MLVINTRNDKLAAARVDFHERNMLNGTCLSEALKKCRSGNDDADDDLEDNHGYDLGADEDEDLTGPVDDELPVLSKVSLARKPGKFYHYLHSTISHGNAARGYPVTSFQELGRHIKQENLETLVRVFLFYQENPGFD